MGGKDGKFGAEVAPIKNIQMFRQSDFAEKIETMSLLIRRSNLNQRKYAQFVMIEFV